MHNKVWGSSIKKRFFSFPSAPKMFDRQRLSKQALNLKVKRHQFLLEIFFLIGKTAVACLVEFNFQMVRNKREKTGNNSICQRKYRKTGSSCGLNLHLSRDKPTKACEIAVILFCFFQEKY